MCDDNTSLFQVVSYFVGWRVTNAMVAGRASAKLVSVVFFFTPILLLFTLCENPPFFYPSISLGAEILYLSFVTYTKGLVPLGAFEILRAVDLPNATQWAHKRSCLSSLALPAPRAFLQPNTLLPCSAVFLRWYPSSAVPSFAPSLLSVTCYKVPDTSHTLHRSVVLSHAQKKIIKKCIKMRILVKNKVWFTSQKK